MPKYNRTKKDNQLRQIRSVLGRLFKDGTVTERSNGLVHDLFPVAINETQGNLLRNWIIKEKAVHTIEVGLAWGISALHICEGLTIGGNSEARHIVIDPFQSSRPKFANCGLQVLDEAGVLSMVEFIPEKSQITLPRFLGEGRQFDFAYVDGSHLFDAVFLDLIYLGQLVRPEGIIFGDDYQAPAVERAVSFCITNLGWKLEELAPLSAGHRWYILRTADKPINRAYPHFIDF
jgi:predicted O-methyltransferase YrrM